MFWSQSSWGQEWVICCQLAWCQDGVYFLKSRWCSGVCWRQSWRGCGEWMKMAQSCSSSRVMGSASWSEQQRWQQVWGVSSNIELSFPTSLAQFRSLLLRILVLCWLWFMNLTLMMSLRLAAGSATSILPTPIKILISTYCAGVSWPLLNWPGIFSQDKHTFLSAAILYYWPTLSQYNFTDMPTFLDYVTHPARFHHFETTFLGYALFTPFDPPLEIKQHYFRGELQTITHEFAGYLIRQELVAARDEQELVTKLDGREISEREIVMHFIGWIHRPDNLFTYRTTPTAKKAESAQHLSHGSMKPAEQVWGLGELPNQSVNSYSQNQPLFECSHQNQPQPIHMSQRYKSKPWQHSQQQSAPTAPTGIAPLFKTKPIKRPFALRFSKASKPTYSSPQMNVKSDGGESVEREEGVAFNKRFYSRLADYFEYEEQQPAIRQQLVDMLIQRKQQ